MSPSENFEAALSHPILHRPSPAKPDRDPNSTAFLDSTINAMDDSQTSSLDVPHSWALADDDKLFLPLHEGDVVGIKSEAVELLLEGSGGFRPYSSNADLSKTSLPVEIATLTHDNLKPWEPLPMSPMSKSNSASSCATFSTAASRSSSTSSVANGDYILGQVDSRYQASALSRGNAKRTLKQPATFQCTVCPKFFTRAYNLRSHMRNHIDERPFICIVCGKTFARDHDRKRHEGLHSGENEFICKGNLQQHGQWGCGRTFTSIGALGRHLRSEAGPICIKPLVVEELSWNKELRQDIHAMEKVGPVPAEERSGNAAFPASLVAQYPGLATLPWSELSQDDLGLDEDIEQSGYFTSDLTISSESSCSTFSSLSSDESNIEMSIDSWETVFSNIIGCSDVTGDTATSNKTVPPDGNHEVLKERVDDGEIHLGHATYIDAASNREHKQDVVGAEPKEPEWTRCRRLTDCQAYGKGIACTQPVGLDATHDLSPAHSSQFETAKVEEPFEQTHSVEVLGSNDSEEDTETIKGAENDVPLSHNPSLKHDQSAQLSPAKSSSSTIGSTLGKASPYSVQSQESESDSCFEGETEMSFDEYGSALSPSPSLFHISDLWAPKQMLIIEILRAFWDIYNKEFPWIISRCIASTAKDFTNGETSGAPSSSSSKSSSSASRSSSTATLSSISSSSGSKRKLSEDDRPSDGSDRGPMEPIQGSMLMPKDQPIIRYACPFRKHNPRKYNMHQHQSCALGSFGSIARVKEHLYRRHMAPIQCVRCWLFFKNQENLNIHISATNICERRDGEAAEGITPSTEKRLRSRKKLSGGQTDNDRWRDIYRMLFPGVTDEDIPSPFYETVQDDAAQASLSLDLPIEEFMRQEVPQFFTSRLQTEVDNMNLEHTGLLDDPARLRETFIARMTSLINEAQDAAVEAYRQKSSENSLQLNQLMTPGPSSSSASFPNPSQELSRAAPYQREDAFHTRQQPAAPSWSRDLQSIDRVAANNALQDYLTTQIAQEAENADLDSRTGSYPQLTKEDAPHSFGLEHTDVEFSTATHIPQQEPEPNGCSLNLDWALSDDWDVNGATWSNNDFI